MSWSRLQSHVQQVLKESFQDKYADVTLVSNDNTIFYAHKFLLASASNFLRDILSNSKVNEVFINLNEFKSNEINALLEYLYFGETNLSLSSGFLLYFLFETSSI